MWVKFTREFDWQPPAEYRVTIAYMPGMRCSVTADCAKAAVAHGAAVALKTPKRDHAAALKADPYWRADADRP